MKYGAEYNYDAKGQPKTVTLPAEEWERIVLRIRKSNQVLKIRKDLKSALSEVRDMDAGKKKMQTWKELKTKSRNSFQ